MTGRSCCLSSGVATFHTLSAWEGSSCAVHLWSPVWPFVRNRYLAFLTLGVTNIECAILNDEKQRRWIPARWDKPSTVLCARFSICATVIELLSAFAT